LVLASEVVLIGGMGAGMLFGVTLPSAVGERVRFRQEWIQTGAWIVASGLLFAGVWLMTIPHPDGAVLPGERWSRRLARSSVWLPLLGAAWGGLASLNSAYLGPAWLASVFGLVFTAAACALVIMTLRQLQLILARIPSRSLTVLARVTWMASILLATAVLISTTIENFADDNNSAMIPPYAVPYGMTAAPLPTTTSVPATAPAMGFVQEYLVYDEDGYVTLTTTVPVGISLIQPPTGTAAKIGQALCNYGSIPFLVLVVTIIVLLVMARFAVGRSARYGRRLAGVS
jgi:hypothetical protein